MDYRYTQTVEHAEAKERIRRLIKDAEVCGEDYLLDYLTIELMRANGDGYTAGMKAGVALTEEVYTNAEDAA